MKSPLRMFKRLFLAFVFSEKQHPFPAAFLLVFFLFSLSLFSSNKTHVLGAAGGEWKEIYLINWAVFFFSCVARGGGLVLWSNVCSSCPFICTFFHAFSWYIGKFVGCCSRTEEVSEDMKPCSLKNISQTLLWKLKREFWIGTVYQVIGYLTRCNADYSTCGASDNNTVIKKGVVSPSLTPPFCSKWDVFFFCSHHLVVPVITHLPLLWFIQQHFIISLWRWIVSCSCY